MLGAGDLLAAAPVDLRRGLPALAGEALERVAPSLSAAWYAAASRLGQVEELGAALSRARQLILAGSTGPAAVIGLVKMAIDAYQAAERNAIDRNARRHVDARAALAASLPFPFFWLPCPSVDAPAWTWSVDRATLPDLRWATVWWPYTWPQPAWEVPPWAPGAQPYSRDGWPAVPFSIQGESPWTRPDLARTVPPQRALAGSLLCTPYVTMLGAPDPWPEAIALAERHLLPTPEHVRDRSSQVAAFVRIWRKGYPLDLLPQMPTPLLRDVSAWRGEIRTSGSGWSWPSAFIFGEAAKTRKPLLAYAEPIAALAFNARRFYATRRALLAAVELAPPETFKAAIDSPDPILRARTRGELTVDQAERALELELLEPLETPKTKDKKA